MCSGDFRPCQVNSQYQPSRSYLFILFCFEMGPHVAQADFKLAIAEDVLERLTLHRLPFTWITAVYHHPWFMWCWGLILSLPMELQLLLCKNPLLRANQGLEELFQFPLGF